MNAVLASLLREPFWVESIFLQVLVAILVFRNQYFRQLPLVTAYIACNLCQAGFLLVVYSRYGFESDKSSRLFWTSEAVVVVVRVLAGLELVARVLDRYRGIRALALRLFGLAFFGVSLYVVAESPAGWEWIVSADRGLHLAFAVALVSCLILIRYYSIPIPALYRSLLGGFCFYSCTQVLRNTLAPSLFKFPYYQHVWDATTLLPFIGLQIWWAVALRKPASITEPPTAVLLSDYERLSPEINARLRKLNDQLGKFWYVETTEA